MKRLISIIVATILLFLSLQNAFAQKISDFTKMPPAQKANIITDTLRRILNLSDAEYNSVQIVALQGIKRAAPVINSDDSKMSKGMQLKSIMNDTEDKLKLILTKQQFAVYQSTKEKMIAYYRQQANDEKVHR